MLTSLHTEELPALKAIKDQPAVSIIMPFNPKMCSKLQIKNELKSAVDKVKKQLYEGYTKETSDIVLQKLQSAIANLDYTTHKKSIAIYVSPYTQKVYYLEIPVVEKTMVDKSFEIRDLVLNKKDQHEFLLLVISAKTEKVYLGNNEKITKIVSNHVAHIRRDLPEKVANFSDPRVVKQTRLKNFLRYIDNAISIILKAYPLPLFIMTTKKTMGYFGQVTKHAQQVIGFVHGNFENASEQQLWQAIQPQLVNWKSIRKQDVLNRLREAQNESRLVMGISDVWRQASHKAGQLLAVEKDFYCSAYVDSSGEILFGNSGKKPISYRQDLVDDIIEKVLEGGGDVEFVDELKEYQHIALIEYCR